jgi:GNAT superfamily N-acetyltransferase
MNFLWQSFLEYVAKNSSRGSFSSQDGIRAAWVHSNLLLNNAVFLSSPVTDENDFRNRLQTALNYGSGQGLPWALYTFQPFLSRIAPELVQSATSQFGLSYLLQLQVMTADCGALEPPVYPLPIIEMRRVLTPEDKWRVLELNMRAYNLPVDMADSVAETGAYFKNQDRDFGFLGFVDGQLVSTASVVEIEGWLYVYLVATDPEHRRKGYAEAVMRHALSTASSQLGITRTSLDASDAGAPLYNQMGYEFTGETWGVYLAS